MGWHDSDFWLYSIRCSLTFFDSFLVILVFDTLCYSFLVFLHLWSMVWFLRTAQRAPRIPFIDPTGLLSAMDEACGQGPPLSSAEKKRDEFRRAHSFQILFCTRKRGPCTGDPKGPCTDVLTFVWSFCLEMSGTLSFCQFLKQLVKSQVQGVSTIPLPNSSGRIW